MKKKSQKMEKDEERGPRRRGGEVEGQWKTPLELLIGEKPKLSHLHPYGCRAYKHGTAG
jgi:hypothetical protein